MSQLNLNIVRSVYDAFDSGDMPTVLQHLDRDVEIIATEGLPWSGTYRGPGGFQEFITNIKDHLRITSETDELFESGESVAQVGRTVGHVHATGAPFDVRVLHIWRLRDGKVVSFANYVDTEAQRRALGLPVEEPPPERRPGGSREIFWS